MAFDYFIALDGNGLNGFEGFAGVARLRCDPAANRWDVDVKYFDGLAGVVAGARMIDLPLLPDAEAAAVQQRLARIEPVPPYHYFQLGLEAMQRRDYAQAKAMFEKEIDRAAYHHEFHFGLALANYGLGNVKEAQRQLGLAMKASTRDAERQLYAGKLERLKALRVQ